MIKCAKCEKVTNKTTKDNYCSMSCYKAHFAVRMKEMKELQKKALEQQQLHAEFMTNPHLYQAPGIPKTQAELQMDNAFNELKQKLHSEQQARRDKIDQAFDHIIRKANGEI